MAKYNYFKLAALMAFCFSFASCELIGDIFQAGVWVGVLIVVAIIGLIVWLVSRGRK